jgi:tetratricopeptide (TPR) repeat protein
MAQQGRPGTALGWALNRAERASRVFERPAEAIRIIDEGQRQYPLADMPVEDRPYIGLIAANAFAGRADQTRAMVARWERDVPAERRGLLNRAIVDGFLALAEGNAAGAREAFGRGYERSGCNACTLDLVGRAWDLEGNADSALAAYERYLTVPEMNRLFFDPIGRQEALRRAGALHEQLGHRDQAIQRYSELLDLWQDADPELQPVMQDIRQRVARLTSQRN